MSENALLKSYVRSKIWKENCSYNLLDGIAVSETDNPQLLFTHLNLYGL